MEQVLEGVIPAAGKGVRARPYTANTHKGMLDINGKPNIQRIIEIMRDELAIRRIVIIVGHLGDSIRAYFGDGDALGVELVYVQNDDLDKGLAWSVYLAKSAINAQHFCIMLCDECYISSNHKEILDFDYQPHFATCCGLAVDDTNLIKRNFAVYLDAANSITRLEEKPRSVSSRIMGTGTFVCDQRVFDLLEDGFAQSSPDPIDFVTTLFRGQQGADTLGYFEIKGTYVNINDRDSLYLAKYHDRKRNLPTYSKALLIYSEGAEENIEFTIEHYAQLDLFTRIVVVLPFRNELEEVIGNTAAEALICPGELTLYGEKLKYAMQRTGEDIIVLTEADYSFPSRDVEKLLTYMPEADMVVGTRTTRQLIEQGSNMRGLVRLANSFLGRLVELLWWNRRGRYTDVGCTFRAIWKNEFEQVEKQLTSRGPEFSAEMMITLLNRHRRVLEIPVNYYNRGQMIREKYQSASTFFRFLGLVISRRLRSGMPERPE
ncbi:MAG: hypothetical protein CME59_19950 [Halioglobus sp.]|nr:hypothetical protein [Halioglobus sp.]|tara:strand:- start:3315 stop:4781 length:1467 start_codon:yes stop_codon:yes gene_type:complete